MNEENIEKKEQATFSYIYSARKREEIKAIRSKYLPKEEDKMEMLRRLDASAARKGTSVSLAVGIFGMLMLGIGMSCTMVWADKWFFVGVVIGMIGIAGIVASYPLYVHITKVERARIAPQIIQLADELMK